MKRGRPKKVEVVENKEVVEIKRGRGRPRKDEKWSKPNLLPFPANTTVDKSIAERISEIDTPVKKKRGRPKKDIGVSPVSNLVNDKVVVVDCTKNKPIVNQGTHSFCPDCGVELAVINIHDADGMSEDSDVYGCPRCNIEVTKDNEITLTITNDGMKLDYNNLTITKFDE